MAIVLAVETLLWQSEFRERKKKCERNSSGSSRRNSILVVVRTGATLLLLESLLGLDEAKKDWLQKWPKLL